MGAQGDECPYSFVYLNGKIALFNIQTSSIMEFDGTNSQPQPTKGMYKELNNTHIYGSIGS